MLSGERRDLLVGAEGALWVGGASTVLAVRGPAGFAQRPLSSVPGYAVVSALLGARAGTLWVGTKDGSSRIREGRVRALLEEGEGRAARERGAARARDDHGREPHVPGRLAPLVAGERGGVRPGRRRGAEGARRGDGPPAHRGPREYDFLERLGKGDIIVVKGRMDTTEEVLDVLELPYTLLERDEAAAKLATLDPSAVLVYNCDSIPQKKLGSKEAAALASFVDRGGYLFTTDWVLTEALVPAMKDGLEPGPMTAHQPFETKIVPSRAAATHPYTRDVFPANPFETGKMKWHVDTMCCTIKPTGRATSLVESPELGQKHGAPCVAATFRHGNGAVLHLIGHFRQQKDGAGDGFAMQQMLVNFIVEKQKFRTRSSK